MMVTNSTSFVWSRRSRSIPRKPAMSRFLMPSKISVRRRASYVSAFVGVVQPCQMREIMASPPRRLWWDVERRIAREERRRHQAKASAMRRHVRPVLRPRNVRDAERVPEHDVGVGRAIGWRASTWATRRPSRPRFWNSPAAYSSSGAYGVTQSWCAMKPAGAQRRRAGERERRRRCAGHERVPGELAERVRLVRVHDAPRARGRE